MKIKQEEYIRNTSIFCIFIVIATLYGCKVLSKQETKSVQALGKALNTGADAPSNFVKQYYQLSFETQLIRISNNEDPELKVNSLNMLLSKVNESDSIVKGYTAGFGILKKYAELLLALTDTGFLNELNRQKVAFIPAFDSLISKYNDYYPKNKLPIKSVGALAGELIDKVGTKRIGYLQRKYLKDLVTISDSVVSHICMQYPLIDFYKNQQQLKSLDETIRVNYKDFVKFINLGNNYDPYSYYKLYDPIFLDWKNKLMALNSLNTQTSITMVKIRKTHNQLKVDLYKKHSFKEFLQKLYDLYSSLNEIEESYKQIQNDLLKSKTIQ